MLRGLETKRKDKFKEIHVFRYGQSVCEYVCVCVCVCVCGLKLGGKAGVKNQRAFLASWASKF